MAWISPNWLTDPVTAKDWSIAALDSDESKANSSAAEALSPSTPP